MYIYIYIYIYIHTHIRKGKKEKCLLRGRRLERRQLGAPGGDVKTWLE